MEGSRPTPCPPKKHTPENVGFLRCVFSADLRRLSCRQLLKVVLVQANSKIYAVYASPAQPLVSPVPLDRTICVLCLNTAIHP